MNDPKRRARSRRARRHLLAIALAVLIGTADADDFEQIEEVEARAVLPAALLRSANYTVDPRAEASANFYHFSVTSDYGTYAITSRAMLRRRLHEIAILAELTPVLEGDDARFDRSPGGRRGVGSERVVDILSDPVGTAAQLLGNIQHNVEETFAGRDEQIAGSRRAPAPVDLNPGPHKRSAAAQLGVDVYSSNPQLQALLETLATARSSGETLNAFSPLVRNVYATRAFGSGVFDARLESEIKNTAAEDVNAAVVALLEALGVPPRLRVAFLTHPSYTPRTRLYFARYVELLGRLEGIARLFEAATSATTEADAVAYVLYARMLAFYQLNARDLERVVTAARFPTLATSGRDAVLALPLDYLAWTPALAEAADTLGEIRAGEGLARFVVLLAGKPTARARAELERRAIEVRPEYSL